MKAAVLASPHQLPSVLCALKKLRNRNSPPGQVLLKVRACGVCRTDLHITEGELPCAARR